MIFPFSDNIKPQRVPFANYLLVVANFAVLMFSARLTPLERERQAYLRGFIPARVAQIYDHQPLTVEMQVEVHDRKLWQVQLHAEEITFAANKLLTPPMRGANKPVCRNRIKIGRAGMNDLRP